MMGDVVLYLSLENVTDGSTHEVAHQDFFFLEEI
jgi:hypothetical protein